MAGEAEEGGGRGGDGGREILVWGWDGWEEDAYDGTNGGPRMVSLMHAGSAITVLLVW